MKIYPSICMNLIYTRCLHSAVKMHVYTQYLLRRLYTGCSFEICSCVHRTSRVIDSFLYQRGRNQCTEHDATFTWSNKENMAECMFHSTWVPTVNHCHLMPAKCKSESITNFSTKWSQPHRLQVTTVSFLKRAQKSKCTLTCVLEEAPSGNT